MMTIITEITIKPGEESRWDKAYEDRFRDAPNQPGWVSVQLLIPIEAPNRRLVLGTWQTRAHWEAWHTTDTFQRTRLQMDDVEYSRDSENWYEVVMMASGKDENL